MAPPFPMMVMKAFIQDVDEDDLGNFITISHKGAVANNQGAGSLAIKYDPDLGDIVVNLVGTGASTGSPTSVHRADTNANYQCPAGKKFVFVAILASSNSNVVQGKLYSSATLDTADGTLIYTQSRNVSNALQTSTGILEIAANQFLTIEHTAGTGNLNVSFCQGVEKDA